MVGPDGKKYEIHGAAISGLSMPLDVLINGNMCEAKEKCVKWPDVDEKTFVRFAQWAYTETYETEGPDIPHQSYRTGARISDGTTPDLPRLPERRPDLPDDIPPEIPLYCLSTADFAQSPKNECCQNKSCEWYGVRNPSFNYQVTCLVCRRTYNATACASCQSVYTNCPTCGPLTKTQRNSCSNNNCNRYYGTNTGQVTCLRCRTIYSTRKCGCGSVFSDCGACVAENEKPSFGRRRELVYEFLDASGTVYPTPTSIFSPRKNADGCEDYTQVFLCHAKLYVMADTYDIQSLKELSLHRLHATLKGFTLYKSRFNDIATLAKYVFENTMPDDKIRDMITLYYACIVEDAREQDGLKSLIDEIPEFAYGLINKMSDRLA